MDKYIDKNNFLIFNDLVRHLYECESIQQLKQEFLSPLKMLIPYSYASILLADKDVGDRSLADVDKLYRAEPVCVPDTFAEAERRYIKRAKDDPFLWLMHGNESTLICESDIMEDEGRMSSPLYKYCYQAYNIYDSMQYSIVCRQKLLGVLTLFRTRVDGRFNQEDMFFLRSAGSHLNVVLGSILENEQNEESARHTVEELRGMYGLTARESEILALIFDFYSNDEIAEAMDIRPYTVQKHIQNILSKLGVSSRLMLFRQYR